MNREVFEWECLYLSSFLKEEYRFNQADLEIISAYVNAFDILIKKFNQERDVNKNIKILNENQTCIPILYLCRHSIELTLKLVISKQANINLSGHNLKRIWKKLKETVDISDEYEELINLFDYLDNDGSKLRYTKDKENIEYRAKPIFIKLDSIVLDTKKLYSYLISLLK